MGAGRASSPIPAAVASSTTAVPSRRAKVAVTGAPSGPDTWAVRAFQPARRAAATVPSPPSAIGRRTHSATGSARRAPASIASAASSAVSVPLKESGAITMRTASSMPRFVVASGG